MAAREQIDIQISLKVSFNNAIKTKQYEVKNIGCLIAGLPTETE